MFSEFKLKSKVMFKGIIGSDDIGTNISSHEGVNQMDPECTHCETTLDIHP